MYRRLLFLLSISVGLQFSTDLHSMKRPRAIELSEDDHQAPLKKRKLDNISFSERTGIIGRTPVIIGMNHAHVPYKKNIEDLRVGDKILTLVSDVNGTRHEQVKILQMHRKEIHEVVFIQTESGHTGVGHTSVGQIILDPDKPFFNPKLRTWVKACNLTKDDVFLNAYLGYIKVKAVKRITLKKSLQIYDLTLENPHVFFICDSAGNTILVHNGFWSAIGNGLKYGLDAASNGFESVMEFVGNGGAEVAAEGIKQGTNNLIFMTQVVVATVAAPVLITAGAINMMQDEKLQKQTEEMLAESESISLQLVKEKNPDLYSIITNDPSFRNDIKRLEGVVNSEIKRNVYIMQSYKEKDDYRIDIDTTKIGVGGGPGGNRPPKRSREEEEKLLKEHGYDGIEKNSRQLIRALKSNIKQARAHLKKIREYKKNPSANDNQGRYRNAKTPREKQHVYTGRLAHLINEVENFDRKAEAVLKALRFLGMNI